MGRRKESEALSAVLASSYWSEADARTVLAVQRRAGLGDAEFGRRHGIRAGRLAWWRRRLAADVLVGVVGTGVEEPVGLVPVRVVGSAVADGERGGRSGATMEVVLRGGCRVRLGVDFDSDAVARLVATLEQCTC